MVNIAFTASETPLGWLIRKFTQSQVSHVFIEYESKTWGGKWAIESGVHGVRTIPAKRARKNVVAEFVCKFNTDEPLKRVGRFVGVRYDFGGLFFFVWARVVWHWFQRKLKKPLNNTKGQFCSELVTRFLQAAGIMNTEKDPELVTPGDLYNFCSFDNRFQKL